MPRPVQTPPTEQLDEVTNGYRPKRIQLCIKIKTISIILCLSKTLQADRATNKSHFTENLVIFTKFDILLIIQEASPETSKQDSL